MTLIKHIFLVRAEQYGVGMIHTFSSAIGREELMLSPQLKREQYSLARVCQRFQAGLMHTLTKLACLLEPHVGAMFIYGDWARNLSFFLHHTFHTSCYLLVKHDCCCILEVMQFNVLQIDKKLFLLDRVTRNVD